MISRRLLSLQRSALLLRQRLTSHRLPVAYFSTGVSRLSRSTYPSLNFGRLDFLSTVSKRSFQTTKFCCGTIVDVHGPAFAESISEGDIRWNKQIGDYVKEDELIAEIETDKTSVGVPAQYAGKIVEFLVPDGEKVAAKQKIYRIELGEEAPAAAEEQAATPKPEAGETKAEPVAKPVEEKKEEQVSAEATAPPPTTAAKPTLEKPLAGQIPTSIPRIPQPPQAPVSSRPVRDIPIAPPPRAFVPPPAPVPATSRASEVPSITGERRETRVKMNRMRQRIAQRLKDAQNTNAMLTTFNEVDMSNVIEMRTRYQKAFVAKHGIKLGLMSPFIRAAAFALQESPVVNAVIDQGEIVYRNYVDMSIAVATPKGLVVPVLRNVEQMDYAKIEKTLNELGIKARDGNLAIEDMEGGTFTISNGGVFGSMFGTPIINPPQSAILGMHAIFDRPVAVNGKVEIRPMMMVALTYDHRLIDGRDAVSFLKKIKSAVEDPRVIMMSL